MSRENSRSIALAMLACGAATWSYSANLFNFHNIGLSYNALLANSHLIPRIQLEPTFTINEYLGEYLTVM